MEGGVNLGEMIGRQLQGWDFARGQWEKVDGIIFGQEKR